MANKKIVLHISGMTCGHCEKRIVSAIGKLNGVLSAGASFPKNQAQVLYDEDKISEKEIRRAIENEGYAVRPAGREKQSAAKVLPVFLIILAVYFILKYSIGFDFFNLIPRIDATISLVALFATGIFTSVHCIAMCGGINLSQSIGGDETGKFKKPLLYNLGRVVSYTAIGAIVGGLSSVLFISITAKGVIMLAAAIFMILMGLSMLGWLPHWLVPRLPKKAILNTSKAKAGKGPFVVGLLNGLLPCGPLQAMQIYALSTGSVMMGALSMFLFSLGTVPLMLGAGFAFTLLKGKFTRSITRVSAVLVILIAVVMFSNAGGLFGWNLAGTASAAIQTTQEAPSATQAGGSSAQSGNPQTAGGYLIAQIKDGVQTVEATLGISGYPGIVVQKGIPVQYNLKADEENINGCNGAIVIPKFNIEKTLEPGDNIVQFIPGESGTIPYTCWMGMISGQIMVVDDLNSITSGAEAAADTQNVQTNEQAITAGGSCCSAGSQATAFAGGRIPVDNVQAAQLQDGVQVLNVGVNDQGYSPAVLVVQKGVKTVIRFHAEKLNSCNYIVTFPDYNGSLDLSQGQTETPELTPESDFTFECGMGMLHGYVKVVENINNIDLDEIKNEVSEYKPASGGGCCG